MAKATTETNGRDLDAEDMLSIHLKIAASLVRVLGQAEDGDPEDMRRSLDAVDWALDRALYGLEGVQDVLERTFPPNVPAKAAKPERVSGRRSATKQTPPPPAPSLEGTTQ